MISEITKFGIVCFFILLGLVCTQLLSADDVIFDSGVTTIFEEFKSDSDTSPFAHPQEVAGRFTFGVDSTITGIRWTGGYFNTTTPVTDAFTIYLYQNTGPSPTLYTPAEFAFDNQTLVNPGSSTIGNFHYAYSADLVQPISLPAGSYWIAITNNTNDDDDDDWFWSYGQESVDSSIRDYAIRTGFFLSGPWASDGAYDMDFKLCGFTHGLLGDVNLDGIVNLLDVSAFVDRVSSGTYQFEADCNQDGLVNLLDVSFFIDILSDG